MSVNSANWLILFAINKPQRQRDIQQVADRQIAELILLVSLINIYLFAKNVLFVFCCFPDILG